MRRFAVSRGYGLCHAVVEVHEEATFFVDGHGPYYLDESVLDTEYGLVQVHIMQGDKVVMSGGKIGVTVSFSDGSNEFHSMDVFRVAGKALWNCIL